KIIINHLNVETGQQLHPHTYTYAEALSRRHETIWASIGFFGIPKTFTNFPTTLPTIDCSSILSCEFLLSIFRPLRLTNNSFFYNFPNTKSPIRYSSRHFETRALRSWTILDLAICGMLIIFVESDSETVILCGDEFKLCEITDEHKLKTASDNLRAYYQKVAQEYRIPLSR
ncbi:15038_t:CDS:2, partial [Dentiscutata erythropus]